MFKEVGKVYKTTNYAMFVATKENRIGIDYEPNEIKYKRLKQQIEEFGSNYNPIICNYKDTDEKLVIISGHHRFIACKSLGVPIKYMIDNEYTFDMSIKETEATKNWTNEDLFKRGLKHQIPLFTETLSILEHSRILRDTEVGRRSALKGLLNNLNLTFNKVMGSLKTVNGIEYLKSIQITEESIRESVRYLNMLSELISTSQEYETDGYPVIRIKQQFADAFQSEYVFIENNYDAIINNFEWLCKHKRTSSQKRYGIYEKITSTDPKLIKRGIKELVYEF